MVRWGRLDPDFKSEGGANELVAVQVNEGASFAWDR